ncbi:MAG: RDD family protein [Promethearchaeota archaeon]
MTEFNEGKPGKYFCEKCGEQYSEEDVFCAKCGNRFTSLESRFLVSDPSKPVEPKPDQLVVADGDARFWGFIIDLIIIWLLTSGVQGIFYVITGSEELWFSFETTEQFFYNYGPYYLIAFVYYVFTELFYGQTVGKMALGTEVVQIDTGRRPTQDQLANILLNNFGKAFLFPIDVILGWILADNWEKESGVKLQQRFFQRLAQQVVVKKKMPSSGVEFTASQ